MMVERRKILSLIFIAFLVLVLPIALLLSRQRQEIRKKAAGEGLVNGNLAVSSEATVLVGQDIYVYIDTGGESYGFIEGKLNYSTEYWESMSSWGSNNLTEHVFTTGPNSFKFGANSKDALLTGRVIRLRLRAKKATTTLAGGAILKIDSTLSKGIRLNGTSQLLSGEIGIFITAATTPTVTATPTVSPTPVVTLAPNSAVIVLGTPTRSGNNLSFPINYEAGANPSTIGLSVHYDTSKLTYVSAVKGSSFNNLQFYGADGAGSDKKLNFGVSGFITSSTSKHAATVNFTLNSGVQSASIWLIKTEISMAGFTTINCTPISGTTCTQTYSPTTPTPTATAMVTATPTATPITGTPTATPVITPTATPGGTPAPLAISNLTSTLNNSAVAKPTPNVRISFDTNLLTTASLVLKLPNGDIYGPSPAPSNLGVFGFPVNPPNRNYVTDDSVFKHTAAVVHHNFDVGSLISGTYYYKVWATAGSQLVSNPGAQYNSFTVGAAGGVAGDTNGNGCVGSADVGQVFFKFKGPGTGANQCNPNDAARLANPVADPNGDFNHDGCVNFMDFAIVTSDRFSDSCNE